MNDDIKFACEKCGQSVSVASVHAGVSLHCPGCGGPLTVPTGLPGSGAGSSGTGGITFNGDAANSEHKPGELVVKRYRLERILGRGGMGVVWLANDEQLNEPVALKFVPPEIRSDKDALKDLRRETQKSRKLSHPNIIRIHDLTQSEDTAPFISMEFVAGETMSSLRGKQPNGLFTWETLRPLVTQLCAALDYAHSQGIVHRDLKPANLMVTESGQVKLADFGIAATISDTMGRVSLDNLSSGTPTYMSPQQIEGFPPSARDDVYALGATLYDLLTSKPPFFRGKIIHQVLNVAPVTPEERLKELGLTNAIPPEITAAIMACLVKDSEQRLPSVTAVAQALGLAAGGFASSPAVSVGTTSQPPAAEPLAEIAAEPQVSNRKVVYWAAAAAALVLILGGLTMAFNRNKSVRESPSTKGPASNSVAAQPQTKLTANPAGAGGVAPSAPAMASRDNLAIGLWIERFTNGNISGATYEFFTDQTLLRSFNGQARKSTWRWIDAPARTILIETDGKPEIEMVIAPDGKSAAAKNLRNGARPVWFRPESSPAAPPHTSSSSIAATRDAPFVNTLGMKFVPVPGITARFSVWETRVQDYAGFAKEAQRTWQQPRTQQQPTLPASMVNFADAEAFCAWLTKKETAAGKLPAGFTYRVPTDAEWSAAVGLPPEPGATPAERNGANPSHFPWGRPWPPTTKEGNYHETDMPAPDGYEETAPVGTFSPNALGIFDLGGNVWEWTSDWYDATQTDRALRGASYQTSSWQFLRSAHRDHYKPTAPFPNVGFRCVLAPPSGASLPAPPGNSRSAAPAGGNAKALTPPTGPTARTVFSNFVPTAVWRDAMSGAWSPAWKLVGTERHQISTNNAMHQLPQVGPNSGIRARFRSQNPKEFFDLLLRMKTQENSRRYGVTMWTHGVQGSELFILNREGKQTKLAKFTSPATLGVNVEHSAEFYAVGNRLTFFFDGKLIASSEDKTFPDGHPAIFAGPGIEIVSLETAEF